MFADPRSPIMITRCPGVTTEPGINLTNRFFSKTVWPDATSRIRRVPSLSSLTRKRPSGDSSSVPRLSTLSSVDSARVWSARFQRSTCGADLEIRPSGRTCYPVNAYKLAGVGREFGNVSIFGGDPEQDHEGLYRSEEHTSELQSLRHLVCRL